MPFRKQETKDQATQNNIIRFSSFLIYKTWINNLKTIIYHKIRFPIREIKSVSDYLHTEVLFQR